MLHTHKILVFSFGINLDSRHKTLFWPKDLKIFILNFISPNKKNYCGGIAG